MGGNPSYARMTVAAAKVLTDQAAADVALYLPGTGDDGAVLYREAGAGLSRPDFERMRASGVPFVYVRTQDLPRCESILESKLSELLASPDMSPEEKAGLVHQVGTSVVRDLTRHPALPQSVDRVSRIVDDVIGCILRDPRVATHMLQMTAHERSTASHMFMVSALSVLLGAEVFGAHQEMLQSVGLAGMMHDIGKLAIGADVLNKTTPLTPEEIELVQQHPVESVRLLRDHPSISAGVRQMILQHHEWYNGRGYPLGVSGMDLLPGSRILAIVDCFHAMIGHRPYRTPFTPPEATRALQSQSGKQFDPDMLECWNTVFQRCWAEPDSNVVKALEPEADELSIRHEHKPMQPPQRLFGSRRKRSRCEGEVAVKCVYAGRLPDATAAPDKFMAAVHDVSRGGLCLRSEHPMYRGEHVHVCLNHGSRETWVWGTVAWCRQDEEDAYRIGLRFVKRISEREVSDQLEIEGIVSGVIPSVIAGGQDAGFPLAPTTAGAAEISEDMRETALETLKQIGAMRTVAREAEGTAVAFADSLDPVVRRAAADVLAGIHTQSARMAFVKLFKDGDEDVRGHVATTAGVLNMADTSYMLRQLLDDPAVSVALRAAGALGRIGEHDGLPIVRRHLKADTEHARLAARTLGEIVGHRFPANAEGIRAARRYLSAKHSSLKAS